MIQELLGGGPGGGGVAVEKRKMPLPGPLVVDASPTTSVISSPASSSPPENLCCPRCDSPNTKFCYYNNYNLTQPRHFCKTCRRYWTKGGALRNVPIGGGCRKMKAAASVISPGTIANGKSGGCKPTRPAVAGQMGTGGGHEFNLDLLPSLWGSCSMTHSSQLLALLRASQLQQNPNHNYHIVADASDPLGQVCNNSSFLWRNDSKYQYQQQNQNHLFGNTPTNSGIQDLYQRLRAPANCGSNDNIQLFSNNVGSGSSSAATATMATTTTTTTTGSILEPLPLLSGGELGYWNPAMSWADLPMPNGAFP